MKKKIQPLVIVFLIFNFMPCFLTAQVYINELMASNSSTITDPDFNESGDWLELYNAGSADKVIGGYYITDDLDNPKKWMIPEGTVIGANSYLLLWADDYNTGLHLSFKFSADGEAAAFVAPDGTILDEVVFGEQITDVSYGRQTDGGIDWIYMENPTPGAANDSGTLEGIAQQPQVNMEGGFYSSPVTVILSPAQTEDEIRYTLDGSQPTNNSTLYNAPLHVEETTTLRARSFRTGYLGSYPLNKTYFINATEHDLPVVSITTSNDLLYNEEDGLFVKIETDSGWVEKEIPAGIEYYEKNGTLAFSANAGISLSGGNTRQHAQKSLEVQFRKKYGTNEIHHKIFANNNRDKFDSFNLRNSGNDFTDRGNNIGTMFSEGLQCSIVENEMNLDISSYQPTVVYINGDYYGLLNLRERQNEGYLEYYHHVDPDSIDMFRLTRGKFFYKDSATIVVHNGDMEHFFNLARYLQATDLSSKEAYEYVKTQVDIKSLINYYIAETYYANIDWPNNNYKLWRPKEEGGKWRWFLSDMDFGFNNFKFTTWPVWEAWWKDMFPLALGEGKNGTYPFIIFKKLHENQEFIDEFVQTYCFYLNTVFDTTRLTNFVDSLKQNIANEMHSHIDRWSEFGGTTSYENWENNIQHYYNFARLRSPFSYGIIQNHYELSDTSLLVISNQKEKGTLHIYGNKISLEKYSGYFFKDRRIEFSAIPKSGYTFKGWKVYSSDNSFTLVGENPIVFTPTDYNRIEAEYETYREIVINEISSQNSTSITDEYDEYDDWIELYNPNDFEVNVAGYYLTDNLDNISKWQIPSTNPEITTIPAKGFLVFWADEQQEQGILHTNFKLSSGGEEVGLAREFGSTIHFIDSLTFPALIEDASYGRTLDGAFTFSIFDTPTPRTANNSSATKVDITYVSDFDILAYPNPVNDRLYIEFKSDGFNVNPLINLYDISGRLVKSIDTRNLNYSNKLLINTSNLDEGIYLLKIEYHNMSYKTLKVIKSKT